MSKLAAQDKFLDLSDYGRPLATLLRKIKKNTDSHPFMSPFVSGGNSYLLYLQNQYYLAFFIILKSIIDGADGELPE
jgi:hypothetical protein